MAEKKTVWDKFLDFGKGWGLIVTLIGLGVTAGVIVQTRIFDSSEQKHDVIKSVEDSPTPEQKQRAYLMDSLDKASAIETRSIRLKKELGRDSMRAIQDSTMLDYVQKNADQIFQIKEELKNNE